MPHKITSVTELAKWLRKCPEGLFAIDGYHGVGKSTTAKSLASHLRIPLIHLDDFLLPNNGGFLEYLRYAELTIALQRRPAIVEGVCLLAVAKRLGIKPDVHVYVEGGKPDSQSRRGTGPLAVEVLAYHHEYKPVDTADILYCGIVNNKEVALMEDESFAVDIAFIQAKTKLALALAAGGMLTLLIGLAVLLYGVTGQDQTVLKAATIEISASGLGGVIMVTSVIWAFFAYKARPTYARRRQMSEKYDSESRLLERHEHESSTQILAGEKTRD
jgi:hypothetical protein